jgi:hypothetical protein
VLKRAVSHSLLVALSATLTSCVSQSTAVFDCTNRPHEPAKHGPSTSAYVDQGGSLALMQASTAAVQARGTDPAAATNDYALRYFLDLQDSPAADPRDTGRSEGSADSVCPRERGGPPQP